MFIFAYFWLDLGLPTFRGHLPWTFCYLTKFLKSVRINIIDIFAYNFICWIKTRLDVIFLLSLLRDFTVEGLLMWVFASFLVMFTVIPLHEFAHGYTAYLFGDNTAKNSGRLTLNPIAHINLFGFAMMLLLGFGWAEPVPINPRNFKNMRIGIAITALAGPLVNFLMAFIGAIVYVILIRIGVIQISFNASVNFLMLFFQYYIFINMSLCIFNLIPVYPLDGSRILGSILPSSSLFKYSQYQRYINIVLFVLLFVFVRTGMLGSIVMAVTNSIIKLAFNIVMLV